MGRCTVCTVPSRSDDETLYVLTAAGHRPRRRTLPSPQAEHTRMIPVPDHGEPFLRVFGR